MQKFLHPRLDTFDVLEDTIVSPQDARKRLESMGYTEDTWPVILTDHGSSHELRALIEVSGRQAPTDINDVYHELFPNEKAVHTIGDDAASLNSIDAFTQFESPVPKEVTPAQVVIHAAQTKRG